MFEKVKKFMTASFTKDGKVDNTVRHSVRTADWLKVLKPDADEALLVAALAHDIERAFRTKETYDNLKQTDKGFKDDDFLAIHQEKSAKVISDFLKENGADSTLIERVKMLVLRHEFGGNEDQNILKDADSLSFFENNIDHFFSKIMQMTNIKMIREKLDWMYDRIDSEQAKEIATPWYQDALKKLEKL